MDRLDIPSELQEIHRAWQELQRQTRQANTIKNVRKVTYVIPPHCTDLISTLENIIQDYNINDAHKLKQAKEEFAIALRKRRLKQAAERRALADNVSQRLKHVQ